MYRLLSSHHVISIYKEKQCIFRSVSMSRPRVQSGKQWFSTDNVSKVTNSLYKDMPVVPTLARPPTFANVAEERIYKKQRLAAGFRLFGKFGYDEGVAGHITLRDPEYKNTFWVNPFGMDFNLIKASDLVRVDETGHVIEGNYMINAAAFVIHQHIHKARPEVEAAAHSHSPSGRAWSCLGRLLDPINQDVLAFYNDLALYSDYGGIAIEMSEGQRIVEALGKKKAAILRNHGILTVGTSVDEAVWWFITLERCCQVQLQAEAASHGKELLHVPEQACKQSSAILGNPYTGWFQFQPLYQRILKETNGDFLL